MAAQPTVLGAGARLFRRRRHLKRYRQIISVLTRNGFGCCWNSWRLRYLRMRRARGRGAGPRSGGTPVCRSASACAVPVKALGPTFVKIGQLRAPGRISCRAEVAGELANAPGRRQPVFVRTSQPGCQAELGGKPRRFSLRSTPSRWLSALCHRFTWPKWPTARPSRSKSSVPALRIRSRSTLRFGRSGRLSCTSHHYGELYDFTGMVAELEQSCKARWTLARKGITPTASARTSLKPARWPSRKSAGP